MILEKIQSDLKQAQKDKKTLVISTLRFLLSEIYNRRIDLRLADDVPVPDEETIAVIRHQAKQRVESIEAFKAGGREELVQKENEELAILNNYLPQQMSADELKDIVNDTLKEIGTVGVGDFGKVMGIVMGKVKGKADGNTVSSLVREILSVKS